MLSSVDLIAFGYSHFLYSSFCFPSIWFWQAVLHCPIHFILFFQVAYKRQWTNTFCSTGTTTNTKWNGKMDMRDELLEISVSITADLCALNPGIHPAPGGQFFVESFNELSEEVLPEKATQSHLENVTFNIRWLISKLQACKTYTCFLELARFLAIAIETFQRYFWKSFNLLICYEQVRRIGSKCGVHVRAISKELSSGTIPYFVDIPTSPKWDLQRRWWWIQKMDPCYSTYCPWMVSLTSWIFAEVESLLKGK